MSSIHGDLRLPKTYRAAFQSEGWIGTVNHRLRQMGSTTAGQGIVYAESIAWGEWKHITKTDFVIEAVRLVEAI